MKIQQFLIVKGRHENLNVAMLSLAMEMNKAGEKGFTAYGSPLHVIDRTGHDACNQHNLIQIMIFEFERQ